MQLLVLWRSGKTSQETSPSQNHTVLSTSLLNLIRVTSTKNINNSFDISLYNKLELPTSWENFKVFCLKWHFDRTNPVYPNFTIRFFFRWWNHVDNEWIDSPVFRLLYCWLWNNFYDNDFRFIWTINKYRYPRESQKRTIQCTKKIRQSDLLWCTERNGIYAASDWRLKLIAIIVLIQTFKSILETLRKYPAVAFITRKCVQNYVVPDTDVTLEKGDQLLIPIKAIHYDEDIYEDPTKFDPDRFNFENKQNRNNYAFIPFGEGPRQCIGRWQCLIKINIFVARDLILTIFVICLF